MARTPPGPAPAPAVQRLRIRYAKRGRLRFTSHRDVQRALERALRRAGVPMAFSAGFTPHPKVSYAGAAPTGMASEAEYVEIAVTERLNPGQLRAALDSSLPSGLDVLEVVVAGPGSLAERLEASVWEIKLPGVDGRAAGAACDAFLAAHGIEVARLTKNGWRTFDVRAAVLALVVRASGGGDGGGTMNAAGREVDRGGVSTVLSQPCAILQAVVRHVTPAVRPDDVLSGLRQVADLVPPVPPMVTRLAQGPLMEVPGSGVGLVGDPLRPDGDAVGVPAQAPPA